MTEPPSNPPKPRRGPDAAARAKARETAKARKEFPAPAFVRPLDLTLPDKDQRWERDQCRWQVLCDPALATGPARGLLTLHLDVHTWIGFDSSFTSMETMAEESSNSYAAVRRAFELAAERRHVRLEEHGRGYRITPLLWVDAEGHPAPAKPYPRGEDTAQKRAQSARANTAQNRAQLSGLRSTLEATALKSEQLSPQVSPEEEQATSAQPLVDSSLRDPNETTATEGYPPNAVEQLKRRYPEQLRPLSPEKLWRSVLTFKGLGLHWQELLDMLDGDLPHLTGGRVWGDLFGTFGGNAEEIISRREHAANTEAEWLAAQADVDALAIAKPPSRYPPDEAPEEARTVHAAR